MNSVGYIIILFFFPHSGIVPDFQKFSKFVSCGQLGWHSCQNILSHFTGTAFCGGIITLICRPMPGCGVNAHAFCGGMAQIAW